MKKNKNISLAKLGMNKDITVDSLQNQSYTFAMNMNIENNSGDLLKLKSEHSNLLASKFKSGFKVIKHETDVVSGHTYFFLTNPTTGVSEFGIIKSNANIDLMTDVEVQCSECDYKNILNEPLENTVPTEYLTYTTLIEDSCNSCLNFDVRYPIKKVVIKNEKLGNKIFFTDNLNTPRYIDENRLAEYNTGCLDCDKLRMFPIYNSIQIEPKEIVIGGNLKQGQHSFYAAYCDNLGNEISEYTSLTNGISIFDDNNKILTNTEEFERTNFAIRVGVTKVDPSFNYYKVVVASESIIDNSVSYYEVGVFPIDVQEFLYTTDQGKLSTTLNNILIPNPNVTLLEGLTESNNHLFGYGITREKEWNLQPIVNLLGGFVKWQTHIAKETLYEDGVNNAIYKGYMRDEVYPLSISFSTNQGYRTSKFPLIARPATVDDKSTIDNLDSQSVNANVTSCNTADRTEKWQIYNTASQEGVCEVGTIPTNTIVEPTTKICTIDSVVTATADSFVIEEPLSFTGLDNFLNDILEEGSCTGYPFCAIIDPSLYGDCAPDFTGCDVPVLQDEFLTVNNIVGEQVNTTYLSFPTSYSKLRVGSNCFPHRTDSNGDFLQDTDFEGLYLGADPAGADALYYDVYERVLTAYNTSAIYSTILNKTLTVNQDLPQSVYFDYNGYADLASAQFTAFTPSCVESGNFSKGGLTILDYTFSSKVHRDSLWYKIESINLKETFILELTKFTQDEIVKTVASFGEKVRVSIYDSSTGGNSLYCSIVDVTSAGLQVLVAIDEVADTIIFKETDADIGTTPVAIPSNLYIVIETPLSASSGTVVGGYYSIPGQGCLGVAIRNQEIDFVEVQYTSIVFDKVQQYLANCNYEVPIVPDCGALPYKYGEFSYWESNEVYADNLELFDSRGLSINESDFSSVAVATEFETKYSSSKNIAGVYTLKAETNLSSSNIRHYKFPDNKVSPFMYETEQAGFTQAVIYPLGITINEETINDFLDIAVTNNLITQEQRDSIVTYEIFRGDRTLNKGVIAKGLSYDMYSYKEGEKDILFSNFPYNSLGDNDLFYDDDTRTNSISHPYGSNNNHNFTFHSPDTEFIKPSLPTEMKVEGYAFGKSRGAFDEVKGHPKYTILGASTKNLASTLATLEVVAEAAVIAAQSANVFRVQVGLANSANPVGIGLNTVSVLLNVVSAAVFKYGRYKYQWIETFRNLGAPENFAYYYSSVGNYNYLKALQTDTQTLRGLTKANYLPEGRFTLVNEVDGEKLEVNNLDRERSVFLSIGAAYPLTYPAEYKNFDNQNLDSNTSSRFYSSSTLECAEGRSNEVERNIASMYISLKNYLPSQYGKAENVTWLTTSYIGDLTVPSTDCLPIFGGDIFIGRHTLKRKTPLFLDTAKDLASLTPFNYRKYSNFGTQPKFYANFLSPDEISIDRGLPDISTEYEFDCLKGERDSYVTKPSKFYLYYYGIPSFLTESTINLNYRTGKPEQKDLFYPLAGDYMAWTQEENVPIRARNQYFYSSVYSSNTRPSIGRVLPSSYSKEVFDVLFDSPNGLMYSLADNNENDLTEPWLIFRPLDKYEFPTSYGKLIELKGIESSEVLGRFSNTVAKFNSVTTIVDDGTKPETQNLGDGFKRRPVTFSETDLGYAGTQSTEIVSNEYGHFFPDMKRGQIFRIPPGGKGLNEISATIGDKPSGMKNWFKEHLPFKVLNTLINNYEDIDVDNPYNGIGVVMGWDSRYKRVFLTKKDYKPLKAMKFEDGVFKKLTNEELELTNTEYFEDVSFTVAYSLTANAWISYYDFKPNYYINHNNYFQTGINVTSDDSEFGLWSHLLSNKSYGVFYGKKYEIGLEYPTINNYSSKTFESVELWGEALRYHNEYDYAYHNDIFFNKINIYNNRESSGNLRLIPQKVLSDNRKYPKTVNGFQEVLITNTNDRWNLNYIYNRVKSESLNQPLWIWDSNQIKKSINKKVVSFTGKKVLERMRGNYFLNYLGYDTDSRFELSFKWAITNEDLN